MKHFQKEHQPAKHFAVDANWNEPVAYSRRGETSSPRKVAKKGKTGEKRRGKLKKEEEKGEKKTKRREKE